jgi:hypothetical protein
MPAPDPSQALTAVLPAPIRARWNRIALQQLAQRVIELDAENERYLSDIRCADDRADYWQEQVRRAEDNGAKFALTQDGRLYRLNEAS